MENAVKLTLEQLRALASDGLSASNAGREAGKKARDYYDGNQLTSEEVAVLKRRRQPIVTFNRVRKKVNLLLGLEQTRRTDPKAYPRTPKHAEGAEIVTDMIRAEVDRLYLPRTFSEQDAQFLIEGTAAVEVIVAPDHNGQLWVDVEQILFEDFIIDPLSRKKDFSDARYIGSARMVDEDEALALVDGDEEARATIRASLHTNSLNGSATREIEEVQWQDAERKRLLLVDLWYLRGDKWCYARFVEKGILQGGDSPYVDDAGRSVCPIVAQSCYVSRKDNARHGVVLDLIPAQDEINKRRSRMLSLLQSSSIWVRDDAVVKDREATRNELIRPDGMPLLNGTRGVDWDFLSHSADIAGHAQLLMHAEGQIDTQGPNPNLMGRGVQGQSGIAIQSQQQAGIVEENEPYDGFSFWKLRVYKAIWYRIYQFYTDERYVRVTDRDNAPEFIRLNSIEVDETGRLVIRNSPQTIDADIVMDVSPDAVTLQSEQFAELAQLLASSGDPELIRRTFPLMVEMSSLRSEVKRRLEELMQADEEDPQAAQMAQMQAMLQARGAEAEVAKVEAEASAKAADAQKTQIETARMVAEMAAPVMYSV